jgi:hypothetical protein
MGILRRLRQRLCSHEMFLDDLGPRENEVVQCPCAKCGKVLEAHCGISLPGRWRGWRKDIPIANATHRRGWLTSKLSQVFR